MPKQFMCPIGLLAMRDPVSCSDGHTYEKAYIDMWRQSPAFKGTSPLTRAELKPEQFPCLHLISLMEDFAKAHVTMREGQTFEDALRQSINSAM